MFPLDAIYITVKYAWIAIVAEKDKGIGKRFEPVLYN